MPKNREFLPVEQRKVNPELLWKKLTAQPETSGALRKTLSSDNVKEYMRIMTSSQAVEAGWLILCGDMSEEQADQYKHVSGDFHICLQELTELALKMSEELKPRLKEFVEMDTRGAKKEGMANLLKSLFDLTHFRHEQIKDLPKSGEKYIGKLADYFTLRVMALIGSDLMDLTKNDKVEENTKAAIRQVINYLNETFHNAGEVDFPGIIYHLEKTAFKRAFEIKKNQESLDKVIGFGGEYDLDEQAQIRGEIEKSLAAVKKESLYKKIPLVELNNKEPQIIALRDEPNSGLRCADISALRINFSDKSIGFPPVEKTSTGSIISEGYISPEIVDFNINPVNGDLCFVSSGVPLNQIISGDRYLALKNYVLFKIKDYLESKEPDIEDLFAYSPLELEARKKRIEAEAKTRQSEEFPEDQIQEIAEEQIKFKPERYIPTKETQEVQTPLGDKFVLPKHFRVAIMDRISGARAEAVIAALRRMLGKEEKTEGSHLFFRSDRNGKILPVPQHSQKDEHHIALPLILDNLKSWQYDPIELAMELGLKIPKKLMISES